MAHIPISFALGVGCVHTVYVIHTVYAGAKVYVDMKVKIRSLRIPFYAQRFG